MNTMSVSSDDYIIQNAPEIELPKSLNIENLLDIIDYSTHAFSSKCFENATHLLIHPETFYHYLNKIYRICPEILLRSKDTHNYILNGIEIVDKGVCPKGMIFLYRYDEEAFSFTSSAYIPYKSFVSIGMKSPKVMKIVLTTDLSE